MLDPDLIARFTAIVGAHNALTDEADIAPHLTEPRGKFIGNSRLVLKPGSTDEVAAILKLANETGTACAARRQYRPRRRADSAGPRSCAVAEPDEPPSAIWTRLTA
jgi:hypothetical protein